MAGRREPGVAGSAGPVVTSAVLGGATVPLLPVMRRPGRPAPADTALTAARGTGRGNGKWLNFLSNLAGFKVRKLQICSDMFEKTNKVVTLGRMWPFFSLLQIPVVFQS